MEPSYIEGIKILFISRYVYVVCLTGYLYYNSLIKDFFCRRDFAIITEF